MAGCAIAAVATSAIGSVPLRAATGTTVVTATVPSATALSTTACASGQANVTHFGLVLPGSSAVTTSDCTVSFGSSNDTARLRLHQADGTARAMFRTTSGALDTTFGTSGSSAAHVTNHDAAYSMDVDAQGRIVLVGSADAWAAARFVAVRFDASGARDTAFNGGTGRYVLAGSGWDGATGVAHAADGSMVISGYESSSRMTAVKLNSSGAPVTGFGSSGVAYLSCTSACWADSVAVQSSGRAVLGGVVAYSGNGTNNAAGSARIVRLTDAGTLDAAFGSSGEARFEVGALRDHVREVLVMPDDTILAAGLAFTAADRLDLFVAKLRADGALDTSFGAGGIRTIPVNVLDDQSQTSTEPGLRLTVDHAGRLLLGSDGDAGSGRRWTVTRLTAGGAIDTSFGTAGTATIVPGSNAAATGFIGGVLAQADGSVLLAGTANDDAALVRLRADGTLDTSFGSAGVRNHSLDDGTAPGTSGLVALDQGPDGRVIAGGTAVRAGTEDLLVARLEAVSVPDYDAATAGWSSGTGGSFGACLRSVGPGAVTDAGTWTASGSCTATDADPWRAVAAAPTASGASVARTGSVGATGSANLRFGLRTNATQAPGSYVAPLVFTVVAPAA